MEKLVNFPFVHANSAVYLESFRFTQSSTTRTYTNANKLHLATISKYSYPIPPQFAAGSSAGMSSYP